MSTRVVCPLFVTFLMLLPQRASATPLTPQDYLLSVHTAVGINHDCLCNNTREVLPKMHTRCRTPEAEYPPPSHLSFERSRVLLFLNRNWNKLEVWVRRECLAVVHLGIWAKSSVGCAARGVNAEGTTDTVQCAYTSKCSSGCASYMRPGSRLDCKMDLLQQCF